MLSSLLHLHVSWQVQEIKRCLVLWTVADAKRVGNVPPFCTALNNNNATSSPVLFNCPLFFCHLCCTIDIIFQVMKNDFQI